MKNAKHDESIDVDAKCDCLTLSIPAISSMMSNRFSVETKKILILCSFVLLTLYDVSFNTDISEESLLLVHQFRALSSPSNDFFPCH